MAGLYIHIPFCEKACPYCDFYFLASKQRIPQFTEALGAELDMRASSLKEKVSTVYFGGGTPSILQNKELKNIIDQIRDSYVLEDAIELTLEANPEHISEEKTRQIIDAGINRVSLGIQSFMPSVLETLGRNHSRKTAIESLHMLRELGIKNISLDLIMGVPGQSLEDFESDLKEALEFYPEHLSVYALTIEDGTPMEYAISSGKLEAPSEDLQAEMYKICYQTLCDAGYEAYEISNYALPSYRSKHNSAYWNGRSFLGFGPSAHSMIDGKRSHNPADLKEYLSKITDQKLALIHEPMDEINRMNEYILTQLRQEIGISIPAFSSLFGKRKAELLIKKGERYIGQDLLLQKDGRLSLSLEGRLMADRIAMELFADEDES